MNEYLPIRRVETVLSAARKLRVGVLGDFSLSGRWFANRGTEGSAESRAPKRIIEREQYAAGGAGNAARALAALGLAEVRAFGVLGSDWRGGLLRDMLHEAGVETQNLLLEAGWSTPLRVNLAEMQLNFANTVELSLRGEEALLNRLEASLPELDALLVVDGTPADTITPQVLEGVNDLAAGAARTVFLVDSFNRAGQFSNMVRRLTVEQAARWLFPERAVETVGLTDFAETALYPQVDCGCPLFISLGEPGCLVLEGGESHLVPGLPGGVGRVPDEVFLAGLTLALAAGAEPEEAARLGHLVAAAAVDAASRQGQPGEARLPAPEDVLALARQVAARAA